MRARTLLAASALCAFAAFGAPARAALPREPALTAATLDGKTFSLAGSRGHVVLVHFWATWCAPCRQEMPVLDAFYKRYRDRGVDVIGISVDRGRDIGQVREVMRAFSFPAALVRDAKPNDFGAQNELPVTFVIDAQGRLHDELRPDTTPLTEANLERIVVPLLPAH
jgi:cytochrome c biogenesis protein CcmG/thiol:disulfide interchange protein DsbE